MIFSVIFSFAMSSVPAQAEGWLDFLFPPKDSGPLPAETLRAPFADEDAVIVDLEASEHRANATPLHMRHRTNKVITQWVQGIIPAMLSYKSASYENEYREKITNFSKVGSEEYGAFLHSSNFLTTLKTGRYDIAGFVQDYPVIVNEGVTDGRYKWLYETNVMVTFFDSNVKGYQKDESQDNTITKEYTITLQLGRFRAADNEHGLLIETWTAIPKK